MGLLTLEVAPRRVLPVLPRSDAAIPVLPLSSTAMATELVVNKLPPKYLIAAGSFLAVVFLFLAGQEGVGRLVLLSIIPLLYFF